MNIFCIIKLACFREFSFNFSYLVGILNTPLTKCKHRSFLFFNFNGKSLYMYTELAFFDKFLFRFSHFVVGIMDISRQYKSFFLFACLNRLISTFPTPTHTRPYDLQLPDVEHTN